ncbi:MAG: PilZ domain-containing protein [Deltaproteobacteria bacterium]|nr:PilZ domain-containing protein [Deltaproteobacteria bacterium]
MATDIEKRQQPRVDVRLPIVMLCYHGRLEGVARNISCSGMFIRSEEPLNKDEYLRLAFEPPQSKPIWVSGDVVWTASVESGRTTNAFSSGFSFAKITDADRDLLKNWLNGQMTH